MDTPSTREVAPLICLIGYRGTGKTTVAERLSSLLGWPFLDADVELERQAGRTIREIFEQNGEAEFRDLESRIVQQLTVRENLILSLGGGAVLRPENRLAIRRGLVIWLQAPPQVIWQRIQTDPTTSARRPNLTSGGMEEIEQLLASRTPLYADCADYALQTADRTPDEIAAEIVCLLRNSQVRGDAL